MTQKRKAEIQRKLSLHGVPAPPDGLSDRIKADIPEYLLAPQRERARLRRWMAISLRVAAAVLLVLTSTIALVQLFSETEPVHLATAAPSINAARRMEKLAPNAPVTRIAQTSATSSATSAAGVAADEVHIELAQASPAPSAATRERRASANVPAELPLALMAPPPPPQAESLARAEAVPPAEPAPAAVAEVQSASADRRTFKMSDNAAPAAPAPAPVAPPVSGQMTISASAPLVDGGSLVPSAQAAEISYAAHDHVFGISIEPDAFGRVKRAIEAGERPPSENVDVEALVNYFAGSGPPSRRGVRLDVEGSPVPVPEKPRTAILRFTIDTASTSTTRLSSPIASDAKINIDLDLNAVASYRRIGSGDANSAAEDVLLRNLSVTGLYELQLKPRLLPQQRIATVRLQYRDVATGRRHTLQRILHVGDLPPSWMKASQRHRLASLGALWGESLKSATSATDVARKAEELAVKQPRDERARELAEAATASSRL